jgi:hypothetical protein
MFGVQKQLRLLWSWQKQINKKSIGNNQNKYRMEGTKGETRIMIPTTRPVVRGGDVSRIAGRTVWTIMSGIAPPGHRRQGRMLREDMKGDNRRTEKNKKKQVGAPTVPSAVI